MKTYNIIFTVFLSFTSLHICSAEDVMLTKSQQIALNVAMAYEEIQIVQFLDYFKPLGFSLNSANEVKANFISLGFYFDSDEYSGIRQRMYTLKGPNKNLITTVIEKHGCEENYINITRINDKIRIDSRTYRYILTLENDKVVLAEEIDFGNFTSSFEKFRYKFLYNENGNLASIEAFKVIGKGKNHLEAKESYFYYYYVKKYAYNETDHKITVSVSKYDIPKNPKTVQSPNHTSAIIVSDHQNDFLLEQYKHGVSGEKSGILEFFSDKHSMLTKTILTIYNPFLSEIREYSYNSLGARDTVKTQIFGENGKFKEYLETYLMYDLKPEGNEADICSYNVTYFQRYFNINKEVFKEVVNFAKYRELVNGVWSEWKYREL
jgi:hypothetical protein